MIDHDRFEMLGGAVMLGEATDAERATFAEHAATCEPCRLDVACAPRLVETIESAKAAETWRPSVSDAILRRIRDSRTSRFGATVGVLGWAVALSIVINVAFVSGLSTRVHDAFAPAPDVSTVQSMKIELESPAPRIAAAVAAPAHSVTVALVHRKHHRNVPSPSVAVAAGAGVPAAIGAGVPAAAADVPDVLAGLGVDGAPDDAKHVAVEPRCQTAPDPVATDAAPVPCASAQELQH